MSEASIRFGLPFIMPGQAQKDVWHNEALAMLDVAVHAEVEAGPTADPPLDPAPGQCSIVASNPSGAWSGREAALACWTQAGLRFVQPRPGTTAWKKSAGHWMHWDGSAWQDGDVPAARIVIGGQQAVGPRLQEVPTPSGGTTIDPEARAAINGLIATLKSHGLID